VLTSRNSLLDARGARRRVLDMYWAAKSHGLKPSSLARPGDHSEIFPEVFRNWLPPTAGCVLASVVYAAVRGHFSLRGMLIGSTVVFGVMFLFSFIMTLWTYKVTWRSPIHGRDALLAAGICPSCAYGIAGIPPGSEGCVVCPECEAAWRLKEMRGDSEDGHASDRHGE
jgi:hypothetical protein